MYLIGLTGGIAAGKSTVARAFADLGAIVIDADQVAREVVEPETPVLAKLVSAFGPDILNPDNSLNRQELGGKVFGNPPQLEKLNAIVHPAVRHRTEELISLAPSDSVVVYDVPLLIEAKTEYPYDLIVVAMASEEVRVQRLVEIRGMSESEARSRIESQATDEERLAVADMVIDTSGSFDSTQEQVANIWRTVALRADN